MLTLYTKELLSRPFLSAVTDGRPYKEQHFPALEKLKTLKPGELQLDEDDSGSDSDPFEDPKDNIEKGIKKAQKKLSRMEKSLQLMQSFSDDFKKAMEETREELKLDSHIYYEDIDQITATLSNTLLSRPVSPATEQRLQTLLSSGWELEPVPPVSGSSEPEGTDLGDTDSESATKTSTVRSEPGLGGMWRQLGTTTGMVVSPPHYNAHRQITPHWLDQPPTRLRTVVKARDKCERWFKALEDDEEEEEEDHVK